MIGSSAATPPTRSTAATTATTRVVLHEGGNHAFVDGAGGDIISSDRVRRRTTVDPSLGAFTLILERRRLVGSTWCGVENLMGTVAGDTLFNDLGANGIDGGQGLDTIECRTDAGADVCAGGPGDDLDVVSYSDQVIETTGGGADGVVACVTHALAARVQM